MRWPENRAHTSSQYSAHIFSTHGFSDMPRKRKTTTEYSDGPNLRGSARSAESYVRVDVDNYILKRTDDTSLPHSRA